MIKYELIIGVWKALSWLKDLEVNGVEVEMDALCNACFGY